MYTFEKQILTNSCGAFQRTDTEHTITASEYHIT